MNLKEIRKKAWAISKENLGSIWNVSIIYIGFNMLFSFLSDTLADKYEVCLFPFIKDYCVTKGGVAASILSLLFALFFTQLSYGVSATVLKIVRKEKYEFNDIFKFKKDFLKLFAIYYLSELIVSAGLMFLIVPGVIFALSYGLVEYVYADNESGIIDTLKESRELMRGHKWEFFLICLNILLWILLSILTFGLLLIWVIPYLYSLQAVFYDEIKKSSKDYVDVKKIEKKEN